MKAIGFSTGALALGDFRTGIEMLSSSKANAIELSALRDKELRPLIDAIEDLDLSSFTYRSTHAPTDFSDERSVVVLLEQLAARMMNVVVHPDTIKTPALWRGLGERLCIENMDSRKRTGRTVEELESIFEALPKARLCFDVGHARQVDPTMTEALRIIRRFGERLAEVHLSEVDSAGGHHPMSRMAVEAFQDIFDMIPDSTPIIIESTVDEQGVDREIALARQLLEGTNPVPIP